MCKHNNFIQKYKYKSYYGCSWALSILLWISIALSIIFYVKDMSKERLLIISLSGILYISYIISQCINCCKALIFTPEEMISKLQFIIGSPPIITIYSTNIKMKNKNFKEEILVMFLKVNIPYFLCN